MLSRAKNNVSLRTVRRPIRSHFGVKWEISAVRLQSLSKSPEVTCNGRNVNIYCQLFLLQMHATVLGCYYANFSSENCRTCSVMNHQLSAVQQAYNSCFQQPVQQPATQTDTLISGGARHGRCIPHRNRAYTRGDRRRDNRRDDRSDRLRRRQPRVYAL